MQVSSTDVATKISIFDNPGDVIKDIDKDIQRYEGLFNEYGERLNKILKDVQRGKGRAPEIKIKKKGDKIVGLDFKKLKGKKTASSDDWLTVKDLKVGRDERNEIWASVLLHITEDIQDKLMSLTKSKDAFTNLKNSGLLGNYDVAVYFKDGIAESIIPLERVDEKKHISISGSYIATMLQIKGGE